MVNLLIVENDKNICKDIINNVFFIQNIRISQVAYTVEEAIYIIKKYDINMIIVNESLPDMIIPKFITVINEVNSDALKVIIILRKMQKNKVYNISSKIIVSMKSNPIDFNVLRLKLLQYSSIIDKNILNYKICKELEKMNFKFRQYGTQYLIDTIYEVINNGNIDINISKEIYPLVARKYNKSANTIHSGIKNTFFSINRKLLKEYMNYYNENEIRLKDLIFTVAENVKNEIYYVCNK